MRKYQPITKTDIEKLLEFQSIFSQPNFKTVRGGGFSYIDYVPELEAFYRLVTQPHWCDYQYKPEEVQEVIFSPEFIAQANLFQIKSMLTYCQRGERFCDGHRGEMIKDGVVGRILKRLTVIKEEGFCAENDEEVYVLTPESIVNAIKSGFVPALNNSDKQEGV